jgi:hypothetical protein
MRIKRNVAGLVTTMMLVSIFLLGLVVVTPNTFFDM